jgi:hypothetical protein
MRQAFLIFALSTLVAGTSFAQKTEPAPATQAPLQTPMFSASDLAAKVPAPKPGDVRTIDGILRGIYDVISGPAGSRDWGRFRSMFLPQARFTQVDRGPDGVPVVISWSVDEFVRDAGDVFAKEGFYENGIVNRPESFGKVTQVFSSYESRRSPGAKPFQRGINSIQLLNDGKRWWVISILWDFERPDNPLPARFAARQ